MSLVITETRIMFSLMGVLSSSRPGNRGFGNNIRESVELGRVIIADDNIGSVDGFNHFFSTVETVICQVEERMFFPAPHPKVSVPILQNLVIVCTVSTKFHLSLPLDTLKNAVMEQSHLFGCIPSIHVVFFQILVHDKK